MRPVRRLCTEGVGGLQRDRLVTGRQSGVRVFVQDALDEDRTGRCISNGGGLRCDWSAVTRLGVIFTSSTWPGMAGPRDLYPGHL